MSEKQIKHLKKLSESKKGKRLSDDIKRKISVALFKGGKPICECGKRLTRYDASNCRNCYYEKKKGLFIKEFVGYSAVHRWIRKNYGIANRCENLYCSGKSIVFEWSLIKGKKIERKRENYWRLCKNCHNLYDNVYSNRKRKKDGTFI